ncbi:Fluconazole resistance protein 1 [Neochlamydia sp. S13]|nr:Fluconazole resistance protein 1 [Neochlamydia sp. S13]
MRKNRLDEAEPPAASKDSKIARMVEISPYLNKIIGKKFKSEAGSTANYIDNC